ncbi:MAG: hypothetical protein ABIX09_01585 [Terrimesophilobacter sp.]
MPQAPTPRHLWPGWRKHGRDRLARRWVQLLVGLFLYGIAISLMVRAAVGISPWDVLAQGISLKTGMLFGLVTNLVGFFVLLLWLPLREQYGVGTILNALLVGPSAQLGLWLIPEQTNLFIRVPMFAVGLLLLAFATGLYIGARFGPGPRDGLMTGLHRRTGIRIWIVRSALELTVLVIGWLLGGDVGFGTLAFALFVGPLVHVAMPLLHVPEATQKPPESSEPQRFSSA